MSYFFIYTFFFFNNRATFKASLNSGKNRWRSLSRVVKVGLNGDSFTLLTTFKFPEVKRQLIVWIKWLGAMTEVALPTYCHSLTVTL